jgi:RNA polymerase sigma-70 factor (ECF subfamily)
MSTKNDELYTATLKIKSGDLSGFDFVYDETKKVVYYTIIGILNDKGLSEDAMQETYVKFLENVSKISSDMSITSYLITIARNIALNTYNKRKKETLLSSDAFDSSYGEKDNDQLEGDSLFKKASQILPSKYYEVLVLYLIDELTFKEISQELHKPLGTILWLYNEAIKKLKKEVKFE